ncbi:hypothetical protein WA158_008057 [Blastocystis sp. Blastoise]
MEELKKGATIVSKFKSSIQESEFLEPLIEKISKEYVLRNDYDQLLEETFSQNHVVFERKYEIENESMESVQYIDGTLSQTKNDADSVELDSNVVQHDKKTIVVPLNLLSDSDSDSTSSDDERTVPSVVDTTRSSLMSPAFQDKPLSIPSQSPFSLSSINSMDAPLVTQSYHVILSLLNNDNNNLQDSSIPKEQLIQAMHYLYEKAVTFVEPPPYQITSTDSVVPMEAYDKEVELQQHMREEIASLKKEVSHLRHQLEGVSSLLTSTEELVRIGEKEQNSLRNDIQMAYNRINELTEQCDLLSSDNIQIKKESQELEDALQFLLDSYKPIDIEEYMNKHDL